VLARLYEIFKRDFKETQRTLNGKLVWWDKRILAGDRYEEGFWHLISKSQWRTTAGERSFDPRRAERLPLCGPTISNANDNCVKVWDFKEATGRLRTYVWLEDWDYVIILEKREQRKGQIFFLITAFYVDGDSKRRNLRSKFNKREK
jgi:hypothetical protein